MVSYTIKRFLGAWPTLIVLITLSFFLMRVAPGGPFSGEKVLSAAVQANLDVIAMQKEDLKGEGKDTPSESSDS